ncbi:MAG TPA: alpha/beta hydrolase [Mycobacteriales bacterium]|nr:alpha/beta hydrolase [Mycobacteriales bacterium]
MLSSSAPARPGRPAAVVLHGVGSTPDFALRCLAGPLEALGYDVVAPTLRGHGNTAPSEDPVDHSLDRHVADLADCVSAYDVRLVAGISLGAEIALRWVADTRGAGLAGLLLCLPGVAGPTSASASANRAMADELSSCGLEAVLRRIRTADGVLPWVVEEVRASWGQHEPASLVAALRAVADAEPLSAPTLQRIDVPVGMVAVSDDLGHPVEIAMRYATLLPRAAVLTMQLADLEPDRSSLGRVALRALDLTRRPLPGE